MLKIKMKPQFKHEIRRFFVQNVIFTVILQFYAHYIKLKLEADGLEVMREQNVIH